MVRGKGGALYDEDDLYDYDEDSEGDGAWDDEEAKPSQSVWLVHHDLVCQHHARACMQKYVIVSLA